MTVALMTPTGCRPAAWALCEKWILHQTHRDFVWFIVDDGIPVQPCKGDSRQRLIYPQHKWRHGENTLHRNLKRLCEAVRQDELDSGRSFSRVFIIEDDEWYHWCYLEWMLAKGKGTLLSGEGWAHYYSLPWQSYKIHKNTKHACLCRTSFVSSFIPAFAAMLDEPVKVDGEFLDRRLWRKYGISEAKVIYEREKAFSVGMKGMPGRAGIGAGHNGHSTYHFDYGFQVLPKWIGSLSTYYRPYLGRRACVL